MEIRSDDPQALLAAAETTVSADGKASADGHILWIAADDAAGAGVDRLVVKSREESGRVVLEAEATDLVEQPQEGNRAARAEVVGRPET